MYNLLMKGYINSGLPQAALNVHEEMSHQGLDPDRLTYNTLIFACTKTGNLDAAMCFFEEMKEKGETNGYEVILPDAVTYTTLLKVSFVFPYFCIRNRNLVREGKLASKTDFHWQKGRRMWREHIQRSDRLICLVPQEKTSSF